MRIVFRPITITGPTMINGDSNYVMLRDFCEHIIKYTKGKCFFYFLMADRYKDYVDDTPKIKHLFFPALFYDFNHFQSYTPYLTGYLFNRRYGKLIADAYICESSAGNVATDNMLAIDDRRCPIFVRESKTMYPGFTHDECYEWIMRDRAIGYTISHNWFDSEVERDLAIRLMNDYLKPNVVADAINKCHVIPCGANQDRIKRLSSPEKNKRFTIFFGGRANSTKNIEVLLDVLNKARILYDFDVNLTTQMEFGFDMKVRYPLFNFYDGVGSDKYVEMMSKAHCFLNASLHEGYSVGLIEALSAGVILLLPNRYWVTDGAYKGYPYIYDIDNPKSALEMIKMIYKNYDREFKKFDEFRQNFIKIHDRQIRVIDMYDFMKRESDKIKFMRLDVEKLSDIRDMFIKEGITEVYLEQFEKRYFEKVLKTGIDENGCPIYLHSYPGRYDLYKSLTTTGLVEDLFDNYDVRLSLS